jgi:hypothetical protein
MRLIIFFLALIVELNSTAYACQPLPAKYWKDAPERVKSNFDNAQFVVLATVVDVSEVEKSSQLDPTFKMKLERAKFRVDRTFKGKLQLGDTFEIDTGETSCGRGVQDQDWVPHRKNPKDRRDYPKQWIIYYTSHGQIDDYPMQPPPFEITISPLSRPVEYAYYDLKILGKLREK